jgi:hypothetical protein
MTTVAQAIAMGEYELAALRLTLGMLAVLRRSPEMREEMLRLLSLERQFDE